MGVALTAAVLAVLAAITALFAEHDANEAVIAEIESANQWAYYQSKGIKGNLVATRIELLTALGKPVKEQDRKKVEQYRQDQDKIGERAKEKAGRVGGPSGASPGAGPQPDAVPDRHRRGGHRRSDQTQGLLGGLVGAGRRWRGADPLGSPGLTVGLLRVPLAGRNLADVRWLHLYFARAEMS